MHAVSNFRPWLSALAAVAIWALVAAPYEAVAQSNVYGYPINTVDTLMVMEGSGGLLSGAQAERVVADRASGGVALEPEAPAGSILIGPVQPVIPFNELIPSWNGHAPAGTGFRVWLQVGGRNPGAEMIDAGSWGEVPDSGRPPVQELPSGRYEIDNLRLNRVSSGPIWIRIDLHRANAAGASPSVRLVALALTNSTGDRALANRMPGPGRRTMTPDTPGFSPVSVATPFRSQVVARGEWIGRICSPASVGMCVARFGAKISVDDLAAMIYDARSNLFGVWHRNVQAAAQQGIRGTIRRYRSFEDVHKDLSRGYVICASIRFAFGELDIKHLPRMYQKRGTEGHIVVVNGIDENGLVIVHDSASKDHGKDNSWRQEDLAKAWFDKGGVAYVFTENTR